MEKENSTGERDLLLREYQATNEFIYHLQRLQAQLSSILLSGIFLFIGLSITSQRTDLFLILFPVVIFISVAASFVWSSWYAYTQDIVDVAIDHKCELEEKLKLNVERLIHEKIRKKPRAFLGIPLTAEFFHKLPTWLSFGLTLVLIFAYIVVLVTIN